MRIMSNEGGLLEKTADHFIPDPGQALMLEILEERRKNGEFLKPTTNGQPNIKPGE